MTIWNFGQN